MTDPNAQRPIYSGLLSPADIIIIGYLIVIAALILISIDRVRYWWLLVAAHMVAIAIVVLIARMVAPRRPGKGLVSGRRDTVHLQRADLFDTAHKP